VRPLQLLLLASLLAGVLVTAQQGRDEEHLTFAVNVDLVVINATVTDGRGRHVAGLTAADFTVSEAGRAQAITLFHAGDAPASIGLVLDNSGSMLDKRADVATAATAFVRARHPDDEMFVVNFNEQASLGLPAAVRFTSDIGMLRSALLKAPAGLTALYDALAVGLAHVSTGTRDRKALVVLSDGGDNASTRSLDAVVQLARQSSATVYTIGIYDETNRDRNPRALRRIAALSGGRAYFPDEASDLEQVWGDIAGAIRSQYTIGYHSTNPARDGAFHTVAITAARKGERRLRVAAREGYLAPAAALPPK